MPRIVKVVPYDPGWAQKFEHEANRLAKVFGRNLMEIHHIGSTAIPGMMAKPTIDLLVVVKDINAVDRVDQALQEIGYQPKGENGIPGRRYFQKLVGEVHCFHVHTFEDGYPQILRHLNFRDYLRTHPNAALEYQTLKLRLASEFNFEPNKYTDGKSELIRQIDKLAADWRELERKTTSNAE